ncbi:MAG: transporter [Candidatus Brocadiales bacterium]
MRLFAPILSLLLCLMAVDDVYASHAAVSGLGLGRSGPIITTPAVPLPVGSFFADIRWDRTEFSRFTDSQLTGFAQKEREVDSTDSLLALSIGLAYGATKDLTVGFRMPYVWQHDIREGEHEDGEGALKREGDSADFGDLTLYGMYRFIENKNRDFHFAGLFGLKFPTGRTTERTNLGGRFEQEHQPGSGSWDPMAGLAFTKHWGRLSLDTNVLYTFATNGSQRTNLGDRFDYNLALSYRLTKERHVHDHEHDLDHNAHLHIDWDLVMELNGLWNQKLEIRDRDDDDSGETLLFLSPGVRMLVNNRLSFTAAFLFPIQEDTNGLEHETDYRVIWGVGVGF